MIDSLERCLKQIDLSLYGRGSRSKGTGLIIAVIEDFARSEEYGFEREVFLGLTRGANGYKGFIDIIISRADGIEYAIEIDSSNKRWSIEKLLDAHKRGYVPIWIRWCTKIKMHIPDIIKLIDLTEVLRVDFWQ